VRNNFGPLSKISMILVCAGFSAIVLALCVVSGAHFKRGIEQEAYRETENTAQILLAAFDEDAANADAILRRLAIQIREQDLTATPEPQLHRMLAQYALQPMMIGPAVFDREGMLIANALSETAPKVSLADRNIFRWQAEHPNESQLYISAPTLGSVTNEWSIQFSRPTGSFAGIVLLSYRLSHFIELYEKLKLSDRGLAGLTGKDGVVRIRTLNGVIGYGSTMPRMPLVYNRILAGETNGTFYGRGGPDGATRIGSFVMSQSTPFYVTVGYDEEYLKSRYMGFFYVLGLCWLVLTAAMIAATAFIRNLEKISQRTRLEVINSAVEERQKISADMHDSIGASLATLLASMTTENIGMADIKRRVGEILMELRFLVDSAEPDGGDLNAILSNVRHRMGGGIELAGITLRWQAGTLPEIPGLTARDALTIKLILMEALSNVLHHSKAKTAAVTARYDAQASAVFIAVEDDGVGFIAANATAAGRGISNMRKRTASISTGGRIAIDSSPRGGSRISLELTVPAKDARQ
jgi:two-component sensor histidine kinase